MKKIRYFLLVLLAVCMLLSGCGVVDPTDVVDNSPTDNVSPTPTVEEPVATPTPMPEKKFVASEYIKDRTLWDMPYFYEDRFIFEIQNGGDCILRDGLGDNAVLFSVEGKERWRTLKNGETVS